MFGVTIPEQYGGFAVPGEELIYAMITVHEIARADLSMSTPVYTLLTIGWSYLVNKYGTEELKQELLPAVARGQGVRRHQHDRARRRFRPRRHQDDGALGRRRSRPTCSTARRPTSRGPRSA